MNTDNLKLKEIMIKIHIKKPDFTKKPKNFPKENYSWNS